jgi:3D (Asp-Asp-Asp) domain-containing protein
MIRFIAFILFFDFVLYPYPIMAKEIDFNDFFSLQFSGLKSDSEMNYCEAVQTVNLVFEEIKNETTPKAVGVKIAENQLEVQDITGSKTTNHGYHQLTAYTSEVAQTDNSPCTTANGFNVCEHGVEDTIAANFLKFGTKVRIPELFGNRVFIVRDRMNKRHPERLDVWFKNKNDAIKFGIKTARVEVVVNSN